MDSRTSVVKHSSAVRSSRSRTSMTNPRHRRTKDKIPGFHDHVSAISSSPPSLQTDQNGRKGLGSYSVSEKGLQTKSSKEKGYKTKSPSGTRDDPGKRSDYSPRTDSSHRGSISKDNQIANHAPETEATTHRGRGGKRTSDDKNTNVDQDLDASRSWMIKRTKTLETPPALWQHELSDRTTHGSRDGLHHGVREGREPPADANASLGQATAEPANSPAERGEQQRSSKPRSLQPSAPQVLHTGPAPDVQSQPVSANYNKSFTPPLEQPSINLINKDQPPPRLEAKSLPQVARPDAVESSAPIPGSESHTIAPTVSTAPVAETDFPELFRQPDAQRITVEQLINEVKSIYTGLTMIEAKCIHADKSYAEALQNSGGAAAPLQDEQWRALISLHRTLLHEHHDFMLASQHPDATTALRRLPSKYSIPARMWKHGIHAFLELLRYRLPASREYMISFIYFAYQMMCLLYETVQSFKDTWIECLGDLGRYRMAIEDVDKQDREIWANMSRFWYSKAADRCPGVGRLYHHLAILARPHVLVQLYLYCRSLTSLLPFQNARESMNTLFEPFFREKQTGPLPISMFEASYLKMHGMFSRQQRLDEFDVEITQFLGLLDNRITKQGVEWKEEGANLAIASIAPLFGYGISSLPLRRLLEWDIARRDHQTRAAAQAKLANDTTPPLAPFPADPSLEGLTVGDDKSWTAFLHALTLIHKSLYCVLKRTSGHPKTPDQNVLPHVHIVLTLIMTLAPLSLRSLPDVFRKYVDHILNGLPWKELCRYFNAMRKSGKFDNGYENAAFPRSAKGDLGPLPEDFLLRGLLYTQGYFPPDLFPCEEVDDEERSIEHASTVKMRCERNFWIMCQLAKHNRWIVYERDVKEWHLCSPTVPGVEHLGPPESQQPWNTVGSAASVATDHDVVMSDGIKRETTQATIDDSKSASGGLPALLSPSRNDGLSAGTNNLTAKTYSSVIKSEPIDDANLVKIEQQSKVSPTFRDPTDINAARASPQAHPYFTVNAKRGQRHDTKMRLTTVETPPMGTSQSPEFYVAMIDSKQWVSAVAEAQCVYRGKFQLHLEHMITLIRPISRPKTSCRSETSSKYYGKSRYQIG